MHHIFISLFSIDYKEMFGLIHVSSGSDQLSIFKMTPGVRKEDWISKIIQCLAQNKRTADTVRFNFTID